ncbi:hypothetical protein AB0D91_47295 [Streptomyces canus]
MEAKRFGREYGAIYRPGTSSA